MASPALKIANSESAPPIAAASPPLPGSQDASGQGLAVLLQLESTARRAETLRALHYVIANDTRHLLSYRQAFVFEAGGRVNDRFRMCVASSVAAVERDAPFVRWAERALHGARSRDTNADVQRIQAVEDAGKVASEWDEHSFPHILWVPLRSPDGKLPGGVWLGRETPWTDHEVTLAERLAESYGHAWCALAGGSRFKPRNNRRALLWTAIAALVVGATLIPVRLSTLAPVEVVADNPTIVSAPIDGVIAEIRVSPNTTVAAGDELLVFEDTALRNQFEVAERGLSVAEAEHRKATQAAFDDASSSGQVAVLEKELELRRAERDYARELLDRVTVKAPAAGLLVYTEKADWVGRPVSTGERIMEVADPSQIKLKIDLPVGDAIALAEGNAVNIFLDVDPLHSLPATVIRSSYHAETLPGDVLAYMVDAQFDDLVDDVRIGLQGTAKIYGEEVPLFFQMFRRPISAARQWLGL